MAKKSGSRSGSSKPRIPKKLRKLTRDEAARLNVSYTAKRRVDASIKHVAASTPTFTDRQVAQAKLGTTKERHTRARVERVRKGIEGRVVVVPPEGAPHWGYFSGATLEKAREHSPAMYQARQGRPGMLDDWTAGTPNGSGVLQDVYGRKQQFCRTGDENARAYERMTTKQRVRVDKFYDEQRAA